MEEIYSDDATPITSPQVCQARKMIIVNLQQVQHLYALI